MSFEFSRRNFMKYTAVAAVALAGASLFTGCKNSGDSYNLMCNGAGKLTVLQVTAEMGKYVEKDKKYTAPALTGTEITIPMKITNGRTNPIYVNPTNFKAVVYNKENKVIKKCNYYNSGIKFDEKATLYETNLAKDSSVSGNIIVKLDAELTEGQYIVLTYCPDLQYNEYSLNWKLTK